MPGSNEFHDHLDECERCREQPFNLCAVGEKLLILETQKETLKSLLRGAPYARSKSNRFDGCVRGFYIMSQMWFSRLPGYAMASPGSTENITFGFYPAKGGGTAGEAAMRWYDIGGLSVPRLEAYNDTFSALWEMRDVLEDLAPLATGGHGMGHDMTPEEFVKLLLERGFLDRTVRENPESKCL